MCEISLVDIDGTSCEPVGGLSETVLIAPRKDFTAVIDPPDDLELTDEEVITIEGPHTFPISKGFTEIVGVQETGTITSTMIGEIARQLFQNEAVITVSGSKAALLGFLRKAKNLRFIALLEEVGSGQLRQLGSSRFPARFSGIVHAIEAAMEGNNSVTLTMLDKQKYPAPIYTGAVTRKPAV